MEALIPKLFILTAEASVVLFLILIVVFVFSLKAKKKDLNAVNELISEYADNKEERLSTLKKQLKKMAYKENVDEQAEKLFQSEKNIIKEFVTLYLRHDIYRLLDYPENMIENNNLFLKTNGSSQAFEAATEETRPESDKSEATANATIQAREQAESNEAHLKELSELRLRNTELNEHLFEALETITALMTEHGKKTSQEVDSNAQKVLEAIIYLRDKRLAQEGGSEQSTSQKDKPSVNDQTLDDSTSVNLGINDELGMDLDNLDEDEPTTESSPETVTSDVINLEDTNMQDAEEDDPWADALEEQATAEAQKTPAEPEATEDDPWADALEEQATAEAQEAPAEEEATEDDPWADALEEQATAEAQKTPAEPEATEDDPWADALEEQATAEAQEAPAEEEADPWADALAEQATAEASADDKMDPWADALAEQEKSEKK